MAAKNRQLSSATMSYIKSVITKSLSAVLTLERVTLEKLCLHEIGDKYWESTLAHSILLTKRS